MIFTSLHLANLWWPQVIRDSRIAGFFSRFYLIVIVKVYGIPYSNLCVMWFVLVASREMTHLLQEQVAWESAAQEISRQNSAWLGCHGVSVAHHGVGETLQMFGVYTGWQVAIWILFIKCWKLVDFFRLVVLFAFFDVQPNPWGDDQTQGEHSTGKPRNHRWVDHQLICLGQPCKISWGLSPKFSQNLVTIR